MDGDHHLGALNIGLYWELRPGPAKPCDVLGSLFPVK